MINDTLRQYFRFGLMLFVLAVPGLTRGQESPNLKSFISPTPTAQALGKYGEVPVSLYNGIPQISIPIYAVKVRDAELPVNLSYHAGGIRVDEMASNVGLGWSLNSGGVITRSIRKVPDDKVGVGYFDRRVAITNKSLEYIAENLSPASSFDVNIPPNGRPEGTDDTWISGYDDPAFDSEPDVFYYNFGSMSGKFFMDENGTFVSIPHQDIQILNKEIETGVGATQWEITTADGVKYTFGKTSSTTASNPVRSALETTSTPAFPTIVTGWYLLEVSTPLKDTIKLYYDTETYEYQAKDSETSNHLVAADDDFQPDNNLRPNEKNVSTKYNNGVKLNRISSPNCLLTFTTGSRQDLPGSSLVQRIDIKNPSESLNKRIDFSYSYFQSNGGGANSRRLRLDNIEESADVSPNRISGGKHVFEYNTDVNLPNWDPFGQAINSQDLWGFYNGANNSILTQSLKVDVGSGQTLSVQGAKRHTSPRYAQANVLTKITYPTGGFTEFNYESNQVVASDQDFQLLNTQPETKSDFLVIVSGLPEVQKQLTLVNPDPITGKIVFESVARQMVRACPSAPNGDPTCYQVYLEGVSPTVYTKTLLKEGAQTLLLDPGTYRISGVADAGMETIYGVKDVMNYYLNVRWEEFPPNATYATQTNKDVGGLRIKRITNYSATGNLNIKKYEYNLFGTTTSSGVLVNFPQSFSTMFKVIYDPGPFAANARYGSYLQVRSYPSSPLQPTQAGPVGYANVTEYSGEYGENGKTEYTFKTALDHPDLIKNYRPFPQPTSFDWRRGLLKLQSVYAFDNLSGDFKILKSIENEYILDKNPLAAYGFSFEKLVHRHSANEGYFVLTGATNYYISGYKLVTEFYFKSKETIRDYFPAGSLTNPMETVTEYDYGYSNGHYQLTSKKERNSNNSEVITTNKYPDDLELTGDEEPAWQLLLTKFMKSTILEQSIVKDNSPLSKTVYRYKVANEMPLLSAIDIQTESKPIEQRVEIKSYDVFGNVLLQRKSNDVDNAYIWGYNNTYPMAQVQNASETEIAFTSFETADLGNWSFSPGLPASIAGVSKTGEKYINLSTGTSISKTGLSTASSYVVSYWSKNGSYTVNSTTGTSGKSIDGWTYYEHIISNPASGSITLTGVGSIDELRLHPRKAQMMTYCYHPEIGIQCATDANNVTTKYEYDLLGRLKVIRDNDQKILKELVYHYKGE